MAMFVQDYNPVKTFVKNHKMFLAELRDSRKKNKPRVAQAIVDKINTNVKGFAEVINYALSTSHPNVWIEFFDITSARKVLDHLVSLNSVPNLAEVFAYFEFSNHTRGSAPYVEFTFKFLKGRNGP